MAKKIVREQNATAAEPEEEQEGQDWGITRITTNRMTRPSSSLKVEVSIEDFASMNQGLIHLLQAIDNSPGGSISTVKLLTKLKSTGYGQHIIRRAVREGYMARKEQPPEGKGNYLVINYLTPKGKALLRKLSEVN